MAAYDFFRRQFLGRGLFMFHRVLATLPETNSSPLKIECKMLEDEKSFWDGLFSGAMLVSHSPSLPGIDKAGGETGRQGSGGTPIVGENIGDCNKLGWLSTGKRIFTGQWDM